MTNPIFIEILTWRLFSRTNSEKRVDNKEATLKGLIVLPSFFQKGCQGRGRKSL